MPATSSLLSVVVLVAALLSVIAFAFTAQNIRYIYLQQLASKITRTQEAVSAGAWYSDTIAVVEVKNIGARGVLVRTLKITVGYVVVYENGDQIKDSYNKVYTDIHLSPLEKKVFAINLLDDVSLPDTLRVERIYINYIAIVVATEKNVYVFDPAPPIDSVVIEIDREAVGKTIKATLPNGETVEFTVYEYLLCGIGSPTRFTVPVSRVEATRIFIARGEERVTEGYYNYGYDYDRGEPSPVSIKVTAEDYNPGGGTGEVLVIKCDIYSRSTSLGYGDVVTVSRGIVLVGAHMLGYDIVAFSFAEDPYPKYYGGSGVGLVNGKSNTFILKIPLPDKDITVFDFLGPQITPWAIPGVRDRDSVISMGSYYSQAILVGQSYTAELNGRGRRLTVRVYFSDPYPILLVITAPRLRES